MKVNVKVEVEIGGKKVEISMIEAEALRDRLNALFPEDKTIRELPWTPGTSPGSPLKPFEWPKKYGGAGDVIPMYDTVTS